MFSVPTTGQSNCMYCVYLKGQSSLSNGYYCDKKKKNIADIKDCKEKEI